jgi:hypothetical protein
VITELDSVKEIHVVDWIDRYSSRIERYCTPAIAVRGELRGHFAEKGSKLSMREFAKVTKDILHISHTAIS